MENNENCVLPSSGSMSNFETGAVRDAMNGKGLPSLIPTCALRSIAKRFEDGATKYGRDNWMKGIPLSRYCDASHRHLWPVIVTGKQSGESLRLNLYYKNL